MFAVDQTFGVKDYKATGREGTDYVNSKLIVMWGWCPADGMFGTNTVQYLNRAKQAGVKIVSVNPRRRLAGAPGRAQLPDSARHRHGDAAGDGLRHI